MEKAIERQVEEQRSLSDVPLELMDHMSTYLSIKDLAQVRAVCRSWRSVGRRKYRSPTFDSTRSSNEPRILLVTTGNSGRCTFYDPIHHYATQSKAIPELFDAVVLGSGYGWLVLTRQSHPSSVFLFNIATNTRVELPKYSPPPYFKFVWLSSSPNSSECCIIGMDYLACGFWITKRGAKHWTYYDSGKAMYLACPPVMVQGKIYCLCRKGCMLVFDPHNFKGSWEFPFERPPPMKRWKRHRSFCQYFLVECEGELLVILLGYDRRVFLFGLDPRRKTWREIESLGDKMLFVSHGSSFIEKAAARGLSNKMYPPQFTSDGYGIVYDCKAKAHITLLRDPDDQKPTEERFRFLKEWKLSSAWCRIESSAKSAEEFAW